MTLLLPAIVPAVGAILVLALASRRVPALVLAGLVLVATLVAAIEVDPAAEVTLGGAVLATTDYARLAFVVLATAAVLLGGAAAAANSRPGGLVALLAALPGAWIALLAADPAIGGWALLGGSVAALVGARLVDGPAGRIGILATALRAIVLAGAVGLAGIPVGASAAGGPVPDATAGGLAFVVVAGALALRTAAVPLHRWGARLADGVPLTTLAATLAWLPAIAIGVTIAWTDTAMAPIAVELDLERGILIAVAVATFGIAPVAAWVADDLGHLVAYLAIAAMGTALLGIAALDPVAWTPTRSWLVVTTAATAGLAGWAIVLVGAYGSRWLPDLRGWGRRSPVLAIALAAIGVAMVGVPGWPGFDARSALVDATIEGPLAGLAKVALLLPLLPLLRILIAGFGPIDATVRDGRSERPQRPDRWQAGEAVAGSERLRGLGGDARTLWRLDRLPAASVLVLLVALVATALSAGGFDLATVAAGPPPGVDIPLEPSLGDPTGVELLPAGAPSPSS